MDAIRGGDDELRIGAMFIIFREEDEPFTVVIDVNARQRFVDIAEIRHRIGID
jgi:hypothetical protein